ncbi:hypothetical protein QA601_13580 [Chitinispirillales bacterium ANBcel5]|uniref:hypothetical protein n=1 Tax=Cellulosispirillum alkaliphilum TaxID=3039283 RepID=UPI002A4ED4A2|nr:hypothetical protein [Chitinispirillales bacterium ANBcel5]
MVLNQFSKYSALFFSYNGVFSGGTTAHFQVATSCSQLPKCGIYGAIVLFLNGNTAVFRSMEHYKQGNYDTIHPILTLPTEDSWLKTGVGEP